MQFITDVLYSMGSFAVIGSLVISSIVAVLGVLPSVFVTGANVAIFGVYYGFMISWAGEVIGAAIAFYLYRAGFKKITDRASEKYIILKNLSSADGNKAGWLIFQARLLPFVPSGIVTLAGAVSNVGLKVFMLATAFGKIPSLFLETIVSYDVINLDKNWLRLVMTVVALVIVYFVLKKESN